MKRVFLLSVIIIMSSCITGRQKQSEEYQSVKLVYDNGDILRIIPPKTEDLKKWSKNYAQNSLNSIIIEQKDSVKVITRLINENLLPLKDSSPEFELTTNNIRIPTDSVELTFSINTSNDIDAKIMVVFEKSNSFKSDSLFLNSIKGSPIRFNNYLIPSNEIVRDEIIKLIVHGDSVAYYF